MNRVRALRAPRFALMILPVILIPGLTGVLVSQGDDVPDMSGDYEFLSAENTLGILEEEGKLKGYIDVAQSGDESDDVLTFQINQGTRQGDRVQFSTAKIHERYYRFSGTVERGKGRTDKDPDFLRLVGDLETVHANAATGQEQVETRHEAFKWKPKTEAGGDTDN
jgi:hypothetical protein